MLRKQKVSKCSLYFYHWDTVEFYICAVLRTWFWWQQERHGKVHYSSICSGCQDQSPETDSKRGRRRGRRALLFLHSRTLLIGKTHTFVIFHALFICWGGNKQKAASTSFTHFLTGSLGSERGSERGRESMVCQNTSTPSSVLLLTELMEDSLISKKLLTEHTH